MPNRKEGLDGRPPLRPGVAEPAKSRVRIGRACDRCKIKKSKCDGNTPCSSCTASESMCEYSARRRREARDWYWGMQDVIDEGFQQLYWACRERRGFPGIVPDEENGRVSTDAILRGLGLSPLPVDNARPTESRSDSILETPARLLGPRSYHPPDVQRQPAALTPISATSDDRAIFGDEESETERGGPRDSAIELDDEDDGLLDALPNSLADSLPDGLGQQLQDGVDANIDPSMIPGEYAGYAGGSTYSHMSAMQFDSGVQLGPRAQHMLTQPVSQFRVPSLNQQRLESVTQSLGTMEQEVWQGRYDGQADGMLRWPGNMSSVYRTRKSDGRGGGDDAANQER